MIERIARFTTSLFVLSVLAGCAAGRSEEPRDAEFLLIDGSGEAQQSPSDIEDKRSARKTILTIGGILLLGAILANEIEENVEDAIEDAVRP